MIRRDFTLSHDSIRTIDLDLSETRGRDDDLMDKSNLTNDRERELVFLQYKYSPSALIAFSSQSEKS
ncbi:hypothetical protein VNO80_09272 [Phaseolus coccineus]|uniref:Uncharacterized protein n=1 Tax=Phaseolus coccineus TaxID=3886 RepID=A0AAN9RI71_PHACN